MEESILMLGSAVVFVTYITFIAVKYGIQKSISDSYYRLKFKSKYLFTLVLWGFSIPVLIVSDSLLMFIAVGLICLVATAPAFNRLKMEYYAHMIGAYGGIGFGFASLIFEQNMIPLALVAILGIVMLKFMAKNYIWWIEIAAFGAIWLGVAL